MPDTQSQSLRAKTAGTIKWNTIDRLGSQVLYLVVGIVLANVLSKEDFGLVGALMIFQAFAIIFVDSGFGAALLQKKNPDEDDYSTVFWFNLAVSVGIYVILFLCAPLIADIFQGNRLIIPLSKVMFLSFIINGLAIVQTNRLMKRMDVKAIAISNMVALIVSGAVAISLALTGYGPWAIVWQAVTQASVKTVWLWCAGKWVPLMRFSRKSLRSIWRVGVSVFSSSMLNTICLNIYNFVIGAFYNLASLGVYTQADKWSKMGSASISQILTASFVPLLSKAQDDPDRFHRYMIRVIRFTAFIMFPALLGMAVLGQPIFHTLFGNKWDEAIPLFQILSVRGIFVVLISLYGNFLLSLGYAKSLFKVEIIKDAMIIVAIFATIGFNSVTVLVWGQLFASLITYFIVMAITSKATGYGSVHLLKDMLPFLAMALTASLSAWCVSFFIHIPILQFLLEVLVGIGVYTLIARLLSLPELTDTLKSLKSKP